MSLIHAPFSSYAVQYVPLIPLFLVYVAGAVMALACRRYSRVCSTLALSAVGLLASETLLAPLGVLYVLSRDNLLAQKPDNLRCDLLALNVSASVFHAAGIVLLLLAVFHGRRPGPAAALPSAPPSFS